MLTLSDTEKAALRETLLDKLIVVEGMDQTGKTTLVDALYKILENLGVAACAWENPRHSQVMEIIRFMPWNFRSAIDEALIFMLGHHVIRRKMRNHEFVSPKSKVHIVSRWAASTAAYQGASDETKRVLPLVLKLSEMLGLAPDFEIYLDRGVYQQRKVIGFKVHNEEDWRKVKSGYERYYDEVYPGGWRDGGARGTHTRFLRIDVDARPSVESLVERVILWILKERKLVDSGTQPGTEHRDIIRGTQGGGGGLRGAGVGSGVIRPGHEV